MAKRSLFGSKSSDNARTPGETQLAKAAAEAELLEEHVELEQDEESEDADPTVLPSVSLAAERPGADTVRGPLGPLPPRITPTLRAAEPPAEKQPMPSQLSPTRIKPAQARRGGKRRGGGEEGERAELAIAAMTTGNLQPLQELLAELVARINELEDQIANGAGRASNMYTSPSTGSAVDAARRYQRRSADQPVSTALGELIRSTLSSPGGRPEGPGNPRL